MVDLESVVLSALVSTVLSGIVSLLVTKRYGPKAVLKENITRSHSEKLVKQTLTLWEDRVSRYCHVGVSFKGLSSGDFSPSQDEGGGVILGHEREGRLFSFQRFDMVVRGPIDPPIDYFGELWSHIVNGYPEVARHWSQLKTDCSRINEEIKGFLDEIAKEVLGPIGSDIVIFGNWNGHSDSPASNFIMLEDIVFLVWLWLEEGATKKTRLQTKTLRITGPTTIQSIDANVPLQIYELDWPNIGHPTLLRSYKSSQCELVKSKIEHVSNSTINTDKVGVLVGQMGDVERFASRLKSELRQIRTEIDLGKNLKGYCEICQSLG